MNFGKRRHGLTLSSKVGNPWLCTYLDSIYCYQPPSLQAVYVAICESCTIEPYESTSTKELIGICPIKSQENANDFFQICLQQWRTSPAYQQLKSCIMSTTTSSVITKIVGFAFGSIALTHVEADYAYRSAFQHALLLTLKERFCEKLSTEDIACYVQDPLYTNCDRLLLGAYLNQRPTWP